MEDLRIQFISEDPGQKFDAEIGYVSPGWYFWDETWSYCYGPFDTEKLARDAYSEYILD